MNANLSQEKKISHYIDQFRAFAQKYSGLVSDSIELNGNEHSGHVVFAAIVHGDEVGTLPAFLSILEKLIAGKIKFGGKVTFILGNAEAALKNQRYIDEDLNRAFDIEIEKPFTHERTRALELVPLLNSADLFYDFHQTKTETKFPFYTFGFHLQSYYWARISGITPMFTTRWPNQTFSASGLCMDEFVRLQNKPAVTLELSQKGFNKDAKIYTETAIIRVLKALDQHKRTKMSLEKLARKNQDLKFLLTKHKEPFLHPKNCLKDGYSNFYKLNKNECVGFNDKNHPIYTPQAGYMMFPKYPSRNNEGESQEHQTELYLLMQAVQKSNFKKYL